MGRKESGKRKEGGGGEGGWGLKRGMGEAAFHPRPFSLADCVSP